MASFTSSPVWCKGELEGGNTDTKLDIVIEMSKEYEDRSKRLLREEGDGGEMEST